MIISVDLSYYKPNRKIAIQWWLLQSQKHPTTLISTGKIWKDTVYMLYDSPNPRMINMNLKFNIFI